MTIYAHTEVTGPYPAYVNISKHADGSSTITVRERGCSAEHATMTMDDAQLLAMAQAIMVHLSGVRAQQLMTEHAIITPTHADLDRVAMCGISGA